MVSAEFALARNDPAEAIETLQAVAPYELGNARFSRLFPAYIRGLAYLALRRGPEANTEFRKILGHQGLVSNPIIGALVHLQLARALAISQNAAEARAMYQHFLAMWKSADRNIPFLEQAKAEYAKLH